MPLLVGITFALACNSMYHIVIHGCLPFPSSSLDCQLFRAKSVWFIFLFATQEDVIRFLLCLNKWETWYPEAEKRFRNYSEEAVQNPPLVLQSSALFTVRKHHLWQKPKEQIIVGKKISINKILCSTILEIILLLDFSYIILEDNKYFKAAGGQMSGHCSKAVTRQLESYFVS